ncbi:MAG TPA: polymer-forming cytoskeletal protein [Bacteroidales bacterium]|nr:polymer-forming cytoskeletal protein [Bacteroidales bacterium]
MAKNIEAEGSTINLIGAGTVIEGNITSNGDIRVDGTLNGNLNTKGKVIVGESGKINGEVYCKNFELEGSIEGKVFTSELLSLRAKSKLVGEITTNKLAIDPGAVFSGKCDMSGSNMPNVGANPESKESKEK